MLRFVVVVACLAAPCFALGARAQTAGAPEGTPAPTPAPSATAAAPDDETAALDRLRALEARLALGQAGTAEELAALVAAAKGSPHQTVRALAVSVLAWLDAGVAIDSLVEALRDDDARVRAAAAQSLLSLARRLDDDARRRVIGASLLVLDDPADEVACSAAELLGVLSLSAATDAVQTRAESLSDVRYACFARVTGLPLRSVTLPDLPELRAAVGEAEPPAPVPPAVAIDDGSWLLVGVAAASGVVAFGVLPTAFVPSRDVLTYDDDRTRITREEVAVLTQLGSALAGAAALGGSAWALGHALGPLNVEEAAAVAIGTGSLGLAGASAQLTFGLRDAPAALATAGGLTAGLLASTGLAYGLTLDVDDEVLAASAMALGGLGAGLIAFTAVPVGQPQIGDAKRVDFGLGLMGMGAGVSAFGALAAGGLFDVPATRSFAVLAGGALGGGVGTALGFLLVPAGDVKSRIACGVGIAGEALGIVAGILVPAEWLPASTVLHGGSRRRQAVVGTAVAVVVEDRAAAVRLGVPVLIAFETPNDAGLGATLLLARF